MRKTISVLLLLCLVLMLFGCGQKTEENVAVSNQAAAKTEPEVKEEQKEVSQKFDKGDVCPVCLDPLENGKELDYCKYSCGTEEK